MKEDLQRVFIHELGHFVAAEISFLYFDYDRRIEKMELYKRGKTDFYDGYTNTTKATSNSYNPDNSANEYVQLFYGCLFETLYRQIKIDECLSSNVTIAENNRSNIGNGRADDQFMLRLSYRPEVIKFRFKWYDFIKNEFWEKVNSQREKLTSFFNLNVLEYATEYDADRYSIDVDRLRVDVIKLIPILKDDFIYAINELKKIQNE